MRTRRAACASLVLTFPLFTGGCGVPGETPPEAITAVPYELSRPSSAPTPAQQPPSTSRIRVWMVREEKLVPIVVAQAEVDTLDTARSAIARLEQGPADEERAQGLSSALGPDVQLSVQEIRGGEAVVDIRSNGQAPSAGQLPLAVGQVVLTLTSIPGVERVSLTAGGAPIEAPLPGGVLTERPLDARDYTYLVAPSATATPPEKK